MFSGLGVDVHFAVLKAVLNTLTHFTQSVSVLYIVSFTINEVCVCVCDWSDFVNLLPTLYVSFCLHLIIYHPSLSQTSGSLSAGFSHEEM